MAKFSDFLFAIFVEGHLIAISAKLLATDFIGENV